MAVEFPGGQHFHLHGRIRFTVALSADGPGVHVLRNMTQRRNLADFVQVLFARDDCGCSGFGRAGSSGARHAFVSP